MCFLSFLFIFWMSRLFHISFDIFKRIKLSKNWNKFKKKGPNLVSLAFPSRFLNLWTHKLLWSIYFYQHLASIYHLQFLYMDVYTIDYMTFFWIFIQYSESSSTYYFLCPLYFLKISFHFQSFQHVFIIVWTLFIWTAQCLEASFYTCKILCY